MREAPAGADGGLRASDDRVALDRRGEALCVRLVAEFPPADSLAAAPVMAPIGFDGSDCARGNL